MKELIEAGADVNQRRDRRLSAPLHVAAEYGKVKAIRILLAAGADIGIRDCDQDTPLLTALKHVQWDAARELVQAGAAVNVWDRSGFSPLHIMTMSYYGKLPGQDEDVREMLGILLAAGANPWLRPLECRGADSVMNSALIQGRYDVVRFLLEGGAKPDGSEIVGVQVAALAGEEDILRRLAAAGSDVEWHLKLIGKDEWWRSVREETGS